MYFFAQFPGYVVIIFIIFSAITLLNLSMPPAVLFLGESSEDRGNLIIEASNAINPLRLVHLLNLSFSGLSYFSRENIEEGSLRTNSFEWRSVVYPLMDSAPIVVVDAREEPTGNVMTEIEHMLHPDRLHKAIFIVEDNGDSLALDMVMMLHPVIKVPKKRIPMVKADDLIPMLVSKTRKRNSSAIAGVR